MIIYLLKTILCSGLLLLVYTLLLEKQQMHRFNRLYLLFSIVFSFVVPLITIETHSAALQVVEVSNVNYEVVREFISYPTSIETSNNFNPFPVTLFIVYMVGTSFLLLRFIRNIYTLLSRIRHREVAPYRQAKLVLTNDKIIPHSFLNFIFINAADFKNGHIEQEILCHELTHVQQKHTWDVLFVECIRILMWFNPFFILYRKAIQLNHEFLADHAVIKKYGDTPAYQQLLIDKASQCNSLLLTSQFNYLLTKKRLIMMTRTTSRTKAIFRQLALVPILAGTVLLFGIKTMAQDRPTAVKPGAGQVESTKEGVPRELLDEYRSLIKKNNLIVEKRKVTFNVSNEDRARLETIYKMMSPEQQLKQDIIFTVPLPPPSKIVPGEKQFQSFKNPDTYGVWVDGKKISNDKLNDYQASDFEHVFISKLYKNARVGKNYLYQVDLETKDYYRQYVKEKTARNEKGYDMFYRVFRTGKPGSTMEGKQYESRYFLP
jgi:bla regulator protein blaR1